METAIGMLLQAAAGLPAGAPRETRLVVPAGLGGYLVGKGGQAIRGIRRESGADIDLQKGVDSDSERC